MSQGIEIKITSDAEQISLLAEGIHAMCLYATGDKKCSLEVQAAIVEALNNVLVHAYNSESGHQIVLHWKQKDRQLRIEIIDYGLSMHSLPEPNLPDYTSENGRGWWIINACVDDYSYKVLEYADQHGLISSIEKADPHALNHPKSHSNILTLLKNF
jgi:serine/threonine-protein kinase RsbW